MIADLINGGSPRIVGVGASFADNLNLELRMTRSKLFPLALFVPELLCALGCGDSVTTFLPSDSERESYEVSQLQSEGESSQSESEAEQELAATRDAAATESEMAESFDEDSIDDLDDEFGTGTRRLVNPPNDTNQQPDVQEPTEPRLPPVFAFASRLRSTNSFTSHLFLANDLETELVVADAVLSFPLETVLAVGAERGGKVFLTTPIDSLTRYDLQADGELSAWGEPLDLGDAMGGGNFGEYGSAFQFVSDNRAYYFHRDRLLIWDPSTMSLVDSVYYGEGPEGGGVFRQDYATTFSAFPLRRGSELYMMVGWHAASGILQETAVIHVDLQTDAVSIVSDTRCGFAREGVFGSDGKIYLASEAYAAAVYFEDQSKAAPSCMIRYDPETKQFDSAFLERRLFGTTGSAGSLRDVAFASLQVGAEGMTFLRVLDPSLAQATVDGARFLASAEPVWRWARVVLNPGPFVSFLDVPPSGGSAVPFHFGDRVFSPSFTFDWVLEGVVRTAISTEMVELTATGPTPSHFSFPGQSFAAFQLQ